MWAVINTYLLFRRQGLTRWQAITKLFHALDELLTLFVALRVHERNAHKKADHADNEGDTAA